MTSTKADASVVPSIKGIPWWAAVLLALILTTVGAYLDIGSQEGGLGRESIGMTFDILLCVGCGLAALLVRRASIFTAMVQPPLIAVFGVTIALLLSKYTIGIGAASVFVAIFPAMVVATAIGLVIGAIRLFSQPLRGTAHH